MNYRCPVTKNDKFAIEDIFLYKKDGFFIEIGALNGIGDSNTFLLETEFNWKGIIVEANSEIFPELEKNRSAKCLNLALYDKITRVKFIESKNTGYSCIVEDLMNYHKNKCIDDGYKIVDVDTIDFETLLTTYNCPKHIDYISMDIEGGEYRSLKYFPFDKYEVDFFSIEGSHYNEVIDLMISNNFIQVKNPHNNIDYELYFLNSSYERSCFFK